jgi:hypothetical protein
MTAKATMTITITLPMIINVVVFIRIIPTFLANPGFEFGILHIHDSVGEIIGHRKGFCLYYSGHFDPLTNPEGVETVSKDWPIATRAQGVSLVRKNDTAMLISTLVNGRQREGR